MSHKNIAPVPPDPLILVIEGIQELADHKLCELAGEDTTHVECRAYGATFRYDGPSAITYWRGIKEVAVRRAATARSSTGGADPLACL